MATNETVKITFNEIFNKKSLYFHPSNIKKDSIANVENVVNAHKNQLITKDFTCGGNG